MGDFSTRRSGGEGVCLYDGGDAKERHDRLSGALRALCSGEPNLDELPDLIKGLSIQASSHELAARTLHREHFHENDIA